MKSLNENVSKTIHRVADRGHAKSRTLIEQFNVVPVGLDSSTGIYFVEINGRLYGYEPKKMSMQEMIRRFRKMLSFSAGKALQWLKDNSVLVYGSKREGINALPDSTKQFLESSYQLQCDDNNKGAQS